MNFLIFRDFLRFLSNFLWIFKNFLELKLIFLFIISTQVMWRNLERLIDRDQWSQARCDVTHRGTSDRMIKSRSSIFT